MPAPTLGTVADRALVLYALVRRGSIELALDEFSYDPRRIEQAEAAREETERWLRRESLEDALTEPERALFAATSGTWPREAVVDALWRKEALGVLLWALQHIDMLPPFDTEFDQNELIEVITSYGAESSFRVNGALRPMAQIEQAWLEADAWFGATEGRDGEDATMASISAERFRALSWLKDTGAGIP